ncbi:histidine kinase dimerization/phosphoacceptor domain -containing protein [Taibaiella soli]|uniref:histidine kinase n=1 Tax=Taibaiella soli TaxID=1649169 RepID=A0A2W2AMZ1_9BACT|nr:histidine kinase dimerization/phosphoacceptor domain -containing protein [Taibaiella soli]PZF74922.1 hypothetical protein DN068_01620 [Taibaiella soli]
MCRQVLFLFLTIPVFIFLFSGTAKAETLSRLPDSVQVALKAVPKQDWDSALYDIGEAYYAMQSDEGYRLAMECYTVSLSMAVERKHDLWIHRSHLGLGTVYDVSNNIEKAIKYYKIYYDECLQMKDEPMAQFRAAYNLAVVYRKIHNADSTYKYAMQMDELSQKSLPLDRHPGANLLIADLMWYTENTKEFIRFFEKIPANPGFKNGRLPMARMYAAAFSNYLMITGHKKDVVKPLLEELKTTNDSSAILHIIYTNLCATGQYKEACFYQDIINDFGERSSRKVFSEMQYRLLNAENELKDKKEKLLLGDLTHLQQKNKEMYLAISLLVVGVGISFLVARKFRTKNKLLGAQNEKILQQKDEMGLMMKEIHHRVKNNLQIICSLIDLQQMKQSDLKGLDEIQSKMKTIALAHELAYEETQMQGVRVSDYLRRMVESSLQTFTTVDNRPDFTVNDCDVTMDISKLIPFALIVNELLFNTIKYVLPVRNNCFISMHCISENGKIRFCYEDNGPGLPEDFDVAKAKTLGMRLIKGFARQMDASMEVTNRPGQALKFCFIWANQ